MKGAGVGAAVTGRGGTARGARAGGLGGASRGGVSAGGGAAGVSTWVSRLTRSHNARSSLDKRLVTAISHPAPPAAAAPDT